MERRHSTPGEQSRALAAERGIRVIDDGVVRSRAELRQAGARMSQEKWQELHDFVDVAAR